MRKIKTEELNFENILIIIDYFDTVTSTMTLQKENFKNNFYTVVAKEQTTGYGRLQRNFESQKGGLYFSTQIKSNLPLADFTPYSLVSGLSILSVLKNKFPTLNVTLKYPNDIYINNKKFGGILIENIKNDYYILGIGLNINNQTFSENLIEIVTSLSIETKTEKLDLDSLLKDILKELYSNFLVFERHGFSPFHAEYTKNCLNLKKEVYVTYQGEKQLSKGIEVLGNGLLLTIINQKTVTI